MPKNPLLPTSEAEANRLIGKLTVGHASQQEIQKIITLLSEYEGLLEEADESDVFGTDGWRHRFGWD